MEAYDTFEHDVLIIGAGGAGLRAAIAVGEAGLNAGVVCKSLLGKAHTVMAEGGIAGALANLDKKDSGRSISPTRCAVAPSSTTGARPRSWRRKRRSACWNWNAGAPSSTARPTA